MAIDDYYKNISPLQSTQMKPASTTNSALDPALKPSVGGGSWMQQQNNQLGPQLVSAVENMPGALQSAYDAKQKSYDSQMGLSDEYIGTLKEPGKNDMWGRFGAAMLQPTRTGSWAEGFGNAATAAMDARSNHRDKESMRQEKLYRAQYALEGLRSDAPNSELQRLKDTIGMAETVQQVGGMTSDMQLGNGLTPTDDSALVADYNKNPNKYAGARGQSMVADAQSRLAKQGDRQWELDKMGEQGKIDIAKEQAKLRMKGNDLTSVDKKAYLEAQGQNGAFISAKRVLERAKEIGPKTYAGILPDERAWINANFGIGMNSKDEADAHIEYQKIMTGEAIKQMADTLKGASTDYEMNKYIDMIADPTLPWESKEPAVNRILEWMKTESAVNSDLMKSLDPENKQYGGDPQSRGKGNGAETPSVGDTVDDISGLPDGAHVQDESGQTYVIRNGQPEPVQQ